MSRVLFLTSAHPGGRGHIGAGEGSSKGNLLALLAAGHEVHVLCFARDNQAAHPEIVARCASYTTFSHARSQSIQAILSNLRYGSAIAPWFFTRVSPKHVKVVTQAFTQSQIERVWIEFPSSLGFARHLKNLELDYYAHDVVSQKIERKPLLKFLAPFVARIEARLLSHIGHCHVVSLKDEALVRGLGFKGQISLVLPNSLEVGEVENAKPITSIIERFERARNIVFFGNMARTENHASIMRFLLSSYPQIRRQCPDIQLWILGLAPKRSLRFLARFMKGVHVTGPVDDPSPAFSAADLCIAPVQFGAGVKIKVLQMLEGGGSVVATPIAAEGIQPTERLIIVEMANFAETVIKILERDPRVSFIRTDSRKTP